MNIFSVPVRVSRSLTITATKEKLYAALLSEKSQLWSPWNVLEPTAKYWSTGEWGKVGHISHWEGKSIGSGEMELVSVDMFRGSIVVDLRFLKPFKSKAKATYTITPQGKDMWNLQWSMESRLPIFAIFFCKMMESMIGHDFDRGLQMLQYFLDYGEVPLFIESLGTKTVQTTSWIGVARSCTSKQMSSLMRQDFRSLMAELSAVSMTVSSAISLYKKADMRTDMFEYIAAATSNQIAKKSAIKNLPTVQGVIKEGKYFVVRMKGPYEFLPSAWTAAYMHLRSNKLKPNKKIFPYEKYLNSPVDTEEKELVTEIYIPLR